MGVGVGAGRPKVFGRTAERRLLAQALDQACAGVGGVVLLVGDGGIGKTTLVEELARRAHDTGARVVRGHGWEGQASPPLVVWHEVLGALGDEGRHDLHPGVVHEALRAAAEHAPLLVVVEDLHAADADSARVVAHLAARLPSARVLVVVTYRPEELRARPEAADALASASSWCRTLLVPPLDAGSAGELAADLLPGGAHLAELPDLVARSDGNPFFLRELLHAGATSNVVPMGVASAVRHRIRHLSEQARALLSLCACAGRQVDVTLVADATGASPDQVLELLNDAVTAGALEQAPGAVLRFRHALVAEALQAGLPPATASRHHLALARALGARTPVRAAGVVHHLVLAGPLAEPSELVRWSERAALDAEAGGAPLEAVRHWQRAAALLPSGGERGRLHERTGHALFAAGTQGDDALTAFDRALDDYEQAGERRRAAIVHSRVGAHLAVYRSTSDFARAQRHFDAAAPLLTTPVERARLLVGVTSLRLLQGEVQDGLQQAVEAERVAREDGRDALAATARLMTGAHLLQLGRLRDGWAALDESFSTQRDRPLVDVQAAWQGVSAAVLLEDPVLAQSYAERARRALQGSSLPGQDQIISDNLAAAYAMTGDLSRARRELAPVDLLGFALQREGLVPAYAGEWQEVARRVPELVEQDDSAGQRVRVALGCWVLGWTARLEGRLKTARRALERPLEDVRRQHRVLDELRLRAELVLVEVAAGDVPAAKAHLARCDELRPADEDLRGLGTRLALAAAAVDGTGFERVLEEADRRRLVWLALDVLARWAQSEPARAAALRRQLELRLDALDARNTGWAALAATASAPPDEVVLRREQEGWLLLTAAGEARIDDVKGLRHLARLVREPEREWHALDLVRLAAGAAPGPHEQPVDDPLVDPVARRAYKARLDELAQEVDDAEHLGDGERAARARAEREALVEHLAAATGLGGRDRGHGDAADRARQSVTKTLRAAVDRIARHDPALAAHLRSALRTGTFTRYSPDPQSALRWTVQERLQRS